MSGRLSAALVSSALLLSCRGGGAAPDDAGRADGSPGLASTAEGAAGAGSASAGARAAKRPPTTDGAIALSNLGAQIAGAEAAVKRDEASEDRKVTLVDLLLMRGEYAG